MVRKKLNFNRDYTRDALEIGQAAFSDDPLREVLNKYSPVPIVESPKGLVPVGDSGLYATPDEPADPADCDRYPSSIYCGENPFSLEPVSLEPSIILDECNIGIQLDGTFGFIKVPPIAIVYRREQCRHRKPRNPNERPPIEIDPNKPIRYNIDTYYIFGCRIADGVNDAYIITAQQYYNTYIAPMYRYASTDYMYEVAEDEIRRLDKRYANYQGDKGELYRISDYTMERAPQYDYLEYSLGATNNPKLVHGQAYGESLHEFSAATDKYIQTLRPPYKFNLYQLSWQQEW